MTLSFDISIILKSAWIETPLGPMYALSDEQCLYVLEFKERSNLEQNMMNLKMKMKAHIEPGRTDPLASIEREVKEYFAGKLQEFTTPIQLGGSDFQKRTWEGLRRIPYGETRNYTELALLIDQPAAARAVAKANSFNQLAIIVPCHRVIYRSGQLGGYAGGVMYKQALLDLEKKVTGEKKSYDGP